MTRLKICCVQDRHEVDLAVCQGAAAIGLVSRMPSGPGVIPEGAIAELAAYAPDSLSTFLLTSETDPERIVEQHRRCGTDVLQLVDRLRLPAYARLRAALPGVRLVQVVHVTGGKAVEEAVEVAPEVDMLLLDSGRPDAPVRELGGTGRTHDWRLSRRIRERAGVPVWLAGGLGPDNVAGAIRTVGPYGVDVCSGLRPDGPLDEGLLVRFARAVRGA